MVREQTSQETAVDMNPARRHGRAAAFDALAALDAVKTPVVVIAPDGRVDFVNTAAEELLRVSGGDVIGTDLRTAVPWLADVVLPSGPTGITAEHPVGGWTRSHLVAATAGTPSADAPALGAPLVVRVSADADGRLVIELDSGADRTTRRTPPGSDAHVE